MNFDPTNHPHRRYNPLTQEYILVSPHRTQRPWNGQEETPQTASIPEYDPGCYLCPGNERAGGQKNPEYEQTFVFVNDFAAVLPPPIPNVPASPHPMMTVEPVGGACDVLIFHKRHDLTLARLNPKDIEAVIDEWVKIYLKRGAQEEVKYVQIFENKGATMGCSNPHPHGQVWSLSAIPTLPSKELLAFRSYSESNPESSDAPKGPLGNPCLLCEYAHAESTLPDRLVVKNDHWLALVPWWAIWPYEILLLPYKRHVPSIAHLFPEEKVAFAEILGKVTKRYDNLFQCSFPYSMGIHQRPIPPAGDSIPEEEDPENLVHVHLHFTPPLLRSASVKKFLVGFELMAEAQRDLTPEQAAAKLRGCSEIHYLDAA